VFDPGQALYWNPGAVNYLVELLLAVVLATYAAHRLLREHRGGRMTAPTVLFGVTFWFLVPALWVSLLRALIGGGWTGYAMPWLASDELVVLAMPWAATFAGVSAMAFAQFAYRFPDRLPGATREARWVGSAMALCVCAEIASSAYTDWTLVQRRIWFRPDWAAGWTSLGMAWAVLVFMRQLAHAQGWSRPQGLVAAFKALAKRPANRDARAARGFILFSLLPIAHTLALVFQQDGRLGPLSIELLISWSALIQLTGLTLVYFGYLPERSSFIFKLTIISLVLLFGAINGACWVQSTPYMAQYRATSLPSAGSTLEFTPQASGGYAVREAWAPTVSSAGQRIEAEGGRIVLPFLLPFYGRRYEAVYISGDGSIGLEAVPDLADPAIGHGVRPAIRPLLVRIPPQGSDVTASAALDRLIVTRRDRCRVPGQQGCYAVQTIIHADGRIVMNTLARPATPVYEPFDPLGAPWMTGITPGLGRADGLPLMRDHYRGFMAHLDQLYAPVLPFTIGLTLVVLLGIPLLFKAFLVRPLDGLLRAMRRFRSGDLHQQVEVTYNDEIGYLAESFNEMARAQHGLVTTLEQQVAVRSAQLADFAARNARLEERNRLSADLHDTVTQTLFFASMLSEGLADQSPPDPDGTAHKLRQLAQMNRAALAELRITLNELRSGDIVEQPLSHLISTLAQEFSNGQGTGVRIECEISGDTLLPLEVQAMMYRIAQESLNNIARHAGARHVTVALEALPGQAMLSISDDGRGFDMSKVPQGHHGLQIMRERARRIDAVLEVESQPECGTTITAIWMQQDASPVWARQDSSPV
jgi:signal transduction histidine kinase